MSGWQASLGVEFDGITIALSAAALRVPETSHPPTIYYLRQVVDIIAAGKAQASYFDLAGEHRESSSAAWGYADPWPAYRELDVA